MNTNEGHAVAGDPWDAYCGASLRIETPTGAVWVYPAPVSMTEGSYPDPHGRMICVITAHNPGGRAASDQENAAAQRRLEDELTQQGWTWWPAAGGDASWTHVEASAAVIGAEESEVAALGADFGQDAIFVLDPKWRRIVGCLSGRVAATGWTVKPEVGDDNGHRHDGEDDEDVDEDDPIVEVEVFDQNFLTGEKAAGFKDFDDYLNWIGRREGLACTLRRSDESITLHSNGHCGVFIAGAWEGPQGPFTVTGAFRQLAEAEVFQCGMDFQSAGWGPGDVATLAGPYLADSEYLIDQVEWCGTDPSCPADVEDLVLATSRWELPGGGWSPFHDGSGVVVLLRIGPRYVVYQCHGGEMIRDDWEAPDDEAAVEAFKIGYGPSPPESRPEH
jgi:hypothetical protein